MQDLAREGWQPLGWEPIWRRHGARWELQPPEPLVVGLVERLKGEGKSRVHDLGCGLGRHLLLLAAEAFETFGSDISPTAVATCRRRLREAGLSAAVSRTAMGEIPQSDGSLDAVVAWNVLYHATGEGVQGALDVVRRKLRPDGYLLATFLSVADEQYARSRRLAEMGQARELDPNTFVIPGETATDKALPHHYSTEQEVREFLIGFRVLSLAEERVKVVDLEERRYQSAHWQVLARREGGRKDR